jgi:hypothetical protein
MFAVSFHSWREEDSGYATAQFGKLVSSLKIRSMRLLSLCRVTAAFVFFQQTCLATESGGWVEVLEYSVESAADDGTSGSEWVLTLWGKTVIEMGEKSSQCFSIWAESKDRLERAGFVDVVETRYKWPMNGWNRDTKPEKLGLWNQFCLFDGVEGYMLRLLAAT